MPSPITDEAFARRMLEAALGGEPQLTAERIDDLMILAVSLDETFQPVYTEGNLNRAASRGWQDKAALTADQYDLGGGAGKTLDRSQWHKHCMQMAAWYADGTFSVLGGGGNVAGGSSRKGGIGVIGLTSSFAREVE